MSKEHEVMSVVGVVGKVVRKVAIFAVYIPPNMKAAELEGLREALAMEIGAIMKAYKNPITLAEGDFNHRDIGGAINEVEDFSVLAMGPTQGCCTIDLIHPNSPESHCDTQILPPLASLGGAMSDHKCIFKEATGYHWVTQLRRTRDDGREEALARDMREWDWDQLCNW